MDRIFELSVKLLLCWTLTLIIFVLLGGVIFGDLNNLGLHDLANWDGRHFLEVAKFGYTDKIQFAFFPLYPILISSVNQISRIGFLYSALLINFIALLGTIYVFFKLLKEYNYKSPLKILIYFLIFPTSFYLISTYSESLFLFLTLLTFLFAKRKKYLLGSIFAMLSLATRISGIGVILGLLVEVFLSKSTLKDKITVLVISPLGFLLYCLFLYVQTGNPFYFIVSELNWDRSIDFPGFSIWAATIYIIYHGIKPENFTILSDLFFTIFGLGMGLRSLRLLKAELSTYSIISVLIPLATSLILSMPRFLLVIFPIFILVAQIKNRIFHISYIIISLAFLFLYFNFFLRNIWIS